MPLLSKVIFDTFDTNNSATIDARELEKIAAQLGYPMKPADVEASLKVIDIDENGEISYGEFARWWAQKDRFNVLQEEVDRQQKQDDWEHWRDAAKHHFDFFDKDKNGTISRKEFTALYENLKRSYKLGTLDEALEELDANGDGEISLEEYLGWLRLQRS